MIVLKLTILLIFLVLFFVYTKREYFSTSSARVIWNPVSTPAGKSFKQISIGQNNVWTISTENKAYACFRPCNGTWRLIHGTIKQISLDPNSSSNLSIFGINNNNNIYSHPPLTSSTSTNTNNWTPYDGGLIHISVSGNGYIWGVNAAGHTYRIAKSDSISTSSTPWQDDLPRIRNKKIIKVEGGPNYVWALVSNSASSNTPTEIWKKHIDGQGCWTQVSGLSGGLIDISVRSDYVWGVNAAGIIYRKSQSSNTSNWEIINGPRAKAISHIGNYVWIVTNDGRILTSDPTSLTNQGCLENVQATTGRESIGNRQGLWISYYIFNSSNSDNDGIGSFISRRLHTSNIDFNWNGNIIGSRQNNVYISIDGFIKAPRTGRVVFQTTSDDGVRINIDGITQLMNTNGSGEVMNTWINQGGTSYITIPISMTTDTFYKIKVEYFNNQGIGALTLKWKWDGDTDFSAVPANVFYTTNTIPYYTACNPVVDMNTAYLDRHPITCRNDELLTGFKMGSNTCVRSDWGNIEYNCKPTSGVSDTDVQTLSTACNEIDGTNINYLDRHNISCPDGRALTEFKLERCSNTTSSANQANRSHRMVYKCARVQNLGKSVNYNTSCQNLDGEYLDGLKKFFVKCPPDEVLTGLQLTRENCKNRVRNKCINYQCAKTTNHSVTNPNNQAATSSDTQSTPITQTVADLTPEARRFLNMLRLENGEIYIGDNRIPVTIPYDASTDNTVGEMNKRALGTTLPNGTFENSTPVNCNTICNNTANCRAWDFVYDNSNPNYRRCSLKDAIGLTSANGYIALEKQPVSGAGASASGAGASVSGAGASVSGAGASASGASVGSALS